MDPLTHALASFTLARAFFPRAGKASAATAVIAGTLPDISLLATFFGPSAYLSWHKTYTHSLLAALLITSLFPAIFLAIRFGIGTTGISVPQTDGHEVLDNSPLITKYRKRVKLDLLFAAPLSAVLLHLAMDALQSDGVMLLWPFSSKRFAADWLPNLDPILLTILVAAIAIPELFRLITSEIGAKAKGHRGKRGAIIGLVVLLLYIATRALLHANAVVALEARTYRDEPPRRVAALPISASPFEWLGVVETERALHEVSIDILSRDEVDPERAETDYKPEPSLALDAALNTSTARCFLASTRFPKASAVSTLTGSRVNLRSYPYSSNSGFASRRVQALIDMDSQDKILSESLAWDSGH